MPESIFSSARAPLIIGHRGASGHALENSRSAFRIAADRRHVGHCDGVELDVHATRDGHFVVYHDFTLPDGRPIDTLSLSTVQATPLTDGSTIPTLAEAIADLSGVVPFVEVKSVPLTSLGALIEALPASSHIHSFDHRVPLEVHRLDSSTGSGVLSRCYPIDPVRQVVDAGATTLWQESQWIDGPLVESCHAAGIAVIAWTVNTVSEAQRLRALGVDGLCGNWPERLR